MKIHNYTELKNVKDAPKWFDDVNGFLNNRIREFSNSLNKGLDFANNFNCEVKSYIFTHNIETEILHNLSSYNGIIIISSQNDPIVGWKDRPIDANKVGITVLFSSGGTTTGTVKYILLGA